MTDETGFAALSQVDGPLPAPEPILEGGDFVAAAERPVGLLSRYSVPAEDLVSSVADLESMAMKLQLHTAMNRLSLRECREVLEYLEVQGVSVKF